MTTRTAALVAVLAAAAIAGGLLAATNSASPAPRASASTVTCSTPRGGGPGYDASIGNRQNGRSVCVATGERLLVVLSGPSPSAAPWRAIHVSRAGVLQIAPLTLMFRRGSTGTNFRAVRAGTVVLSAARPACGPAPSGAPTCGAVERWHATVIVRAARSA